MGPSDIVIHRLTFVGFLPHSIRLVLREHNFDLAASCETEKEVWAAALCEARNESIIPPFELPASVSPFPIRSRRMSITSPPVDFIPEDPPNNRHTLVGAAEELDIGSTGPVLAASPEEASSTPPQSPTRSSFGFTPDRRPGQPSTILLRRASATQRLIVDRGVIDVFSESCSTARSKAQMNHALFLPDGPSSDLRERMSIRDSSMLRRRRSFLDARPATFDIAFSGEIRGSVIPIRQTRSSAGKRRTLPAKRRRAGSIGSRGNGNESSTEVEGRQSADETVMSDFGTLTGPAEYTRVNSSISVSRMPSLRRSFSNLRRPEPSGLNRRKTALAYSLNSRPGAPNRAKSMPASPVTSHEVAVPPLLITKTASDNRARVFEGFGDTSPVYALSNGLTKQADRPLTSSKWGSLRRSLSFVRSQRNSVISLVDLAGTPSSVDMAEQSRSCGSEEGISRDTSTATLSDRGEEEDEFKELTSTTSTSSSVPSTPKKKRNSRIFQSLSRFTPI